MPTEQAKRGVNFVTLGRHRRIEPERGRRCVCACVRVCMPVRACMHARACVRACMLVRQCTTAYMCVRDVFAIYNNNISSRLIMIIIQIIILYFIQITHTDDFPLNEYPASIDTFANKASSAVIRINVISPPPPLQDDSQ